MWLKTTRGVWIENKACVIEKNKAVKNTWAIALFRSLDYELQTLLKIFAEKMLHRKQQESCANAQLWADLKNTMQGREVQCALFCVCAFIGHFCLCAFAEAETQCWQSELSEA